MKIFLSIVIYTVVVLLLVVAFIYSGTYDISVSNRDSGIVRWVLNTTRENSVEHHAKDIQIPNLNDTTMINNGYALFERGCGCHGNPERDPSDSFNPAPPDLAESGKEMEPNELFWMIKNGIKMSAMPKFDDRFNDDQIWNVVAFLKEYPDMSLQEYKQMKEKMNRPKTSE